MYSISDVLNERNYINEKLDRIKIMSDGDLKDFIDFKNSNTKYILLGILIVIICIIPLIFRKLNLNTHIQYGGDIGHILLAYKILLVVLIIFIAIGYLSLKKFSVYCFACSKGSWWYKCVDGTGYGSIPCDIYKNTYNSLVILTDKVYDIVKHTTELLVLVQNNIQIVNDAILDINNKIKDILVLPDLTIPKITNFPSIKCNITIPIINKDVNICEPIETMIHTILDSVNKSLSFLDIIGYNITSGLNLLLVAIINIFGDLINKFINIFEVIIKPIDESIEIIKILKSELINIYDVLSSVGIINIILYNLLQFVNKIVSIILNNNGIFKINNTSDIKIGFMLSIIIILFIIICIFPIIGGIYLGISALIDIILIPINIILSIF